MIGVFCDGQSARLRRDLPAPEPGPGEVLVRVRRAGICDTDLQLARGYMGFRGILGHEFLGTLDDGTRVTAEINNACRACDACRSGRGHHCPKRTVLGILGHDGAMAESVAVPAWNLHRIPDAIDDDRAIFIEPLAAAFRIAEQIPIAQGLRIAVVGDGKLGLLCAWALGAGGASVTLVGKHPDKLNLAGHGIEPILLDDTPKLGRAFDVVVEASGSPTGLPTALGLVRPLGTLILKTTIAGEYTINLAPIVIDEITVVGSRCGPFPRAIAALASGEVDPTPLLGPTFPLDRADEALAAASSRGARKVTIAVP